MRIGIVPLVVILLYSVIGFVTGGVTTIYLAPDGTDSTGCGLQLSNACRTLNQALIEADPVGASFIFGDGIYIITDSVNISSRSASLMPYNPSGSVVLDGSSLVQQSYLSVFNSSIVIDKLKFVRFGSNAILSVASVVTIGDSLFYNNSVFAGSAFGSAIRAEQSSNIALSRCGFSNNTAIGIAIARGGAVHVDASSTLSMDNCVFVSNSASASNLPVGTARGGGVFAAGPVQAADCFFANNTVTASVGAFGGAVALQPTASAVTMTGCVFASNAVDSSSQTFFPGTTTSGSGGAVYIAVQPFATAGAISLRNNVFARNQVTGPFDIVAGGGVAAVSALSNSTVPSAVSVINCTFTQNSVITVSNPVGAASGGALSLQYNNASSGWRHATNVSGCLFSGNSATGSRVQGGALALTAAVGECGQQIISAAVDVTLQSSVFERNVLSSNPLVSSATGGAVSVLFALASCPQPTASVALSLSSVALTVSDVQFINNQLQQQTVAGPVGGGALAAVATVANMQGLQYMAYANNVSITVIDCLFRGNTAQPTGGALLLSYIAAPTQASASVFLNGDVNIAVASSVFDSNAAIPLADPTAGVGGGAVSINLQPFALSSADSARIVVQFTSCLFSSNMAVVPGAASADGGAIYVFDVSGSSVYAPASSLTSITILFSSTNFSGNAATATVARGGAISAYEAVSQSSVMLWSFSGCQFTGNYVHATATGLGASLFFAPMTAFVGNGGSLVYNLTLRSCTAVNNSVTGSFAAGGAVSFQPNSNLPSGGSTAKPTLLIASSYFGGNVVTSQCNASLLSGSCTASGGAVFVGLSPLVGTLATFVGELQLQQTTFVGNLVTGKGNMELRGGALSTDITMVMVDNPALILFNQWVTDCLFSGNTILSPVHASGPGFGGAVAVTASVSKTGTLLLYNVPFLFYLFSACEFAQNSVIGAPGSQIILTGGALLVDSFLVNQRSAINLRVVNVVNCSFVDNSVEAQTATTAALGGAATTYDTVFSECSFVNNSVGNGPGDAAGGALSVSGGQLVRSNFTTNWAHSDSQYDHGGAVQVTGSELNVIGCVFTANAAADGSGMFTLDVTVFVDSSEFHQHNEGILGCGAFFLASSVTIVRSQFHDNVCHSGGGIYTGRTSFTMNILDTDFVNNYASIGGGLFVEEPCVVQVSNSRFILNSGAQFAGAAFIQGIVGLQGTYFELNSASGYGGAVFTNAASLTVGDSVFVNNSAASGGVLALDGQSTVRVFSSNMTDNSAYNAGGAVSLLSMSQMRVDGGSVLARNSAWIGGGVYVAEASSADLQQVTLQGNAALSSGGAIYVDTNFPVTTTSATVIVQNTAAVSGGGVYLAAGLNCSGCVFNGVMTENVAVGGGGGLFWDSAQIPLYDASAITNNHAAYGGNFASRPVGLTSTGSVPASCFENATASAVVWSTATPLLGLRIGCSVKISISARDYYNNVVVAPSEPIDVVLSASAYPCLTGGTETTLVDGRADFSFTLTGPPQSNVSVQFVTTGLNSGNVLSDSLSAQLDGVCFAGASTPPTEQCGVCTSCVAGSFNLGVGGVCTFCEPEQARCAGVYIWAQDGYFALVDNVTTAVSFASCPLASCLSSCNSSEVVCEQQLVADNATFPYLCHDLDPYSPYVSGYCEAHNRCRQGRMGFLCGACAQGYGLWNSECVDCTNPMPALIALLFFVNWAITVVLYMVLSGSSSGYSKSLIYFVQVALSLVGPANYSSVIFGVLNFKPSSGHLCPYWRDFYLSNLQQVLLPVVSLLQLLLTFAAFSVARLVLQRANTKYLNEYADFGRFRARWLDRPLFALLLGSYTPIALVAFDLLNCRLVAGTFWVLSSAPAYPCGGELYLRYRGMAIALQVLVVAGLPLALAALLYRLYSSRSVDTMKAQCGVLYECYRSRWYAYELVVLLRRVILVAIATFILDNGVRQLLLAVACVAVAGIQVMARPFHTVAENVVELCSLVMVSLIAVTVSSSAMQTFPHELNIALSLVISLTVAGIVIVIAWNKVVPVLRGLVRRFRGLAGNDEHEGLLTPLRVVSESDEPKM